jgi:hypothetical protein
LILSGADIGYELGSSAFYKDVLKAEFVNDGSNDKTVTGLGLTVKIEGGDGARNQDEPDIIKARQGAELILKYGMGEGAGIKVGQNLVYLSFGLEGVATAEHRAALMGKLLEAFQGSAAATATDTLTPARRGASRIESFEKLFN